MIASRAPETIGVLVTTYRRPKDLIRCLQGLAKQTRLPDDVVVVAREDDRETLDAMREFDVAPLQFRIVTVDQPGLVYARNAGCDACRTDVFCMTDDDAVPTPDWTRLILEHFRRDARLGGVGGRDRCFDGESFDDGRADIVGKVQWFGRVIGNHHLGYGAARYVDVLKGANMSYRAEAMAGVRVDTRLRGSGAQPAEDMNFSLSVKRAGWKLLYDPAVLVYHYVGRREEARYYSGVIPLTEVTGFRNFAFNKMIAMWDYMPPWQRAVFVAWSLLIGTGVSPGIVQAIRFTPRLGLGSWHRFAVEQQGKFAALRVLLAHDASARRFFKR